MIMKNQVMMIRKNIPIQYTLILIRLSFRSFVFFNSVTVSAVSKAVFSVFASTVSRAGCWAKASPCKSLYAELTSANFFSTLLIPRNCERRSPSSRVRDGANRSSSEDDDPGVNGLYGTFATDI